MPRPLALIRAPSNLGLRPLHPGHEPGTWCAPEALTAHGLLDALHPARVLDLPRPVYSAEAQSGTRLLNGPAMRSFNLLLADVVEQAAANGELPLVLGGDCSILLGALAGQRRLGPLSLVHVDGHSDFRHPGNYEPHHELVAAAGMNLALATGRGEPLMTDWPHITSPLVPDTQAFQLGERESRDPDWPWHDIRDTAIERMEVFEARAQGPAHVLARIEQVLERQPAWPFWLHFDVDVLDQAVMPAVDSPGSPGIDPADLEHILKALIHHNRLAGVTVSVFDPDLDPDGRYATFLASFLLRLFSPRPL